MALCLECKGKYTLNSTDDLRYDSTFNRCDFWIKQLSGWALIHGGVDWWLICICQLTGFVREGCTLGVGLGECFQRGLTKEGRSHLSVAHMFPGPGGKKEEATWAPAFIFLCSVTAHSTWPAALGSCCHRWSHPGCHSVHTIKDYTLKPPPPLRYK